MSKPRLLDLFSGASGCAVGYDRAGFEVACGVDIDPQPHYPFPFVQADVFELDEKWLRSFDVIHASPPCQAYTPLKARQNGKEYPDLLGPTRKLLQRVGRHYVIENVPGAPLEAPICLCGSSFGLPLRRHRFFETSFALLAPPCNHGALPENIEIMNRGWKKTRFVPVHGSGGCKARELWPIAMGIDWMTTRELAQAIPPAYTEWLGKRLLAFLEAAA
jgi:DNA (cytosine-5)-methyltransferase 1